MHVCARIHVWIAPLDLDPWANFLFPPRPRNFSIWLPGADHCGFPCPLTSWPTTPYTHVRTCMLTGVFCSAVQMLSGPGGTHLTISSCGCGHNSHLQKPHNWEWFLFRSLIKFLVSFWSLNFSFRNRKTTQVFLGRGASRFGLEAFFIALLGNPFSVSFETI